MTDASGKMMMAAMFLNMGISGATAGLGVGQQAQSGINAITNIGASAAMGFSMGGGPVGAAVGAGLGALTSLGDLKTMFGFNDAQIAADEMKKVADELREGFVSLKESMGVLVNFDSATPLERIKAIRQIVETVEGIEKVEDSDNAVVKQIRGNIRSKFNVDEIVKSGGRKGMPVGGVDALMKKLEEENNQIQAAARRGEMKDIFSAIRAPIMSEVGMDQDNFKVPSMETTGVAKRVADFQAAAFSDEIQAALLAVPAATVKNPSMARGLLPPSKVEGIGPVPGIGQSLIKASKQADLSGVEALIQIRDLTKANQKALAAAQTADSPSGIVVDQAEQKAIGDESMRIAKLFRQLLLRAGLEPMAQELDNAIKEGEGTGATKAAGKIAVGQFMGSLVSDPRLQAFQNPEALAAATRGKDAASKGAIQKGDLSLIKRLIREDMMLDEGGVSIRANRKMGRLNRDMATRAVDRSNAGRMASITMAGDQLINRQGQIQRGAADDKAEKARRSLKIKANETLDKAEIKLRDELIGSIDKQLGTYEDQAETLRKFHENYKNVSNEDMKARIEELEMKQKGSADLSTAEKAEKTMIEKRLLLRLKSETETGEKIKEINKARDNEKENIKRNTEALIKQRKAMEEFQMSVEVFNVRSNARKTKNRADGLKEMRAQGIFGIGAKEQAEADRVARRAAIRERGVPAANPGAAFREAFAYDEIDAVHEFEEGVVSVAENMQSSFSSAFQSIASGASSAGDAFAGMAQSILDSISQMSFDMASKMMFKSMGFANGGLVKGYQSGGLVTGGSGHKDDVLTKMQGGEFVIRKSAVNKLGVGTLNAMNEIPGYAKGGKAPGMGKMLAIGAGAAALGGVLRGGGQSAGPKPLPSQDYGFGRSKYGFLGGPDPDARGADRLGGGGGAASVSLNKAFVYYRRDPKTGALISEAARPTEGRFEVSDRLSLLGRLGEGDPQTARMFEKEQRMSKYQNYLATETQRRKDAVDAVKRKKRGNLIQAYASAAMLIGGAKFMSGGGGDPIDVGFNPSTGASESYPVGYGGTRATGGSTGGGLARVMGGEYIMSPSAVRTHGVNVMSELNRGNLPGYAAGGLVGNQGGAAGTPAGGIGDTTNNVKININVDKSGGTEATAEATEQKSTGQERDDVQETEKNKELGKILQGVVLQEIVKQQRPGGLLQQTGQKTSR